MKETTNVADFDFGFTLVNSDELEEVQIKSEIANTWEQKAKMIYESVVPLLDNLSGNDEKDYIYWPNRSEKIQQFKSKLRGILEE